MGSWNHSCSITNLPVLGNDKVIVAWLLQGDPAYSGYIGDHCYVNTYYNLLPFFATGRYDDYGRVSMDESPAFSAFLKLVNGNALEMKSGKNKYHNPAVIRGKIGVDELFDIDHCNRLFVAGDTTKVNSRYRLTHIVIRERVFKDILANFRVSWYSKQSYNYNDIASVVSGSIQTARILNGSFLFPNLKKCEDKDLHKIASALFGSSNSLLFSQTGLSTLIPTLASAELEKLECDMVAKYILDIFMGLSRRVWVKPSGVGSQNESCDAQIFGANLVLRETDKIKGKSKE